MNLLEGPRAMIRAAAILYPLGSDGMLLDGVLIATLCSGFALCAAYAVSEIIDWRREKASELKRSVIFRELHTNRLLQ